jgi:hypothetical protein
MKRLSRKELTEKVDVLELKVKSLQEYIYKDKFLNKYFQDNFYKGGTMVASYFKVKSISGDKLRCDIISFDVDSYRTFRRHGNKIYRNGRLFEDYEESVSKLMYCDEIDKQEFDDKTKLLVELKFNIKF